MKSKTKIEKQLQRKSNNELVETIILAKKNEAWLKVAEALSSPRRQQKNLNLNEISEKIKTGEKVLITGKILSQGEIDKKTKLIALGFSEKAKEKLLKSGCEISSIIEEIKKNPSAKDLRILQ